MTDRRPYVAPEVEGPYFPRWTPRTWFWFLALLLSAGGLVGCLFFTLGRRAAPSRSPLMNAPATRAETSAVALQSQQFATQQTSSLMLSPQLMDQMMAVARAMAEAKITVPLHFRGQPGDCLAVVMQATQWNMNPFAVAQKTHVVNGTLGYEAQLVNAVLEATGAIDGAFKYEFQGDGNTLQCRVGAVCRGDRDITWGEWLSANAVTTKNSPLWKTNPKQQMGYLQVKNWARAFKPGAILGVYTTDELQAAPGERHMGAADEVAAGTGGQTAGTASEVVNGKPGDLPPVSDAELAKRDSKISEFYSKGKSADDIVAFYATKWTLSDAQKQRIRGLAPAASTTAAPADPATDVTPKVTYAEIADRIVKAIAAKDRDALITAGDLIRSITDDQQRAELQAKFDEGERALAA